MRRGQVSPAQVPPPQVAQRFTGATSKLALAVALLLAACASYVPAPLPTAPDTAASLANLTVDPARLKLAPLQSITIDPADGFTPLEIAVLAVLNNPDLVAKRAALGAPNAQLIAAGLLPEPQIDLSADHPYAGPDTDNAYSLGPSIDLAALMGRAASRAAAKAGADQANLDLLWAEWGVAQQARDLAETLFAQRQRAEPLEILLQEATQRAQRSQAAMARGDLTASDAAADIGIRLDAQAALTALSQDQAKAQRDLHALLGLEPDVFLLLTEANRGPAYDAGEISAALASLPSRRPDLLALQAGYQAQDAKLRGAILAQFPVSQIGAALARDTAGVSTIGLAASLALPVSGVARAQAGVESATREQLRAEYRARLDQTRAEVQDAQARVLETAAAAQALSQATPQLDALTVPVFGAYTRGEITSQAYLELLTASLSRRADLEDSRLAQVLAQDRLENLLFLPPRQGPPIEFRQ